VQCTGWRLSDARPSVQDRPRESSCDWRNSLGPGGRPCCLAFGPLRVAGGPADLAQPLRAGRAGAGDESAARERRHGDLPVAGRFALPAGAGRSRG
jgi:hypothetical protein